ncbi:MAG TPA: lipoyl(octanoyl) transferase LipB [Bacteroidetes bacterium]|nr:lipoyl(octanoyl) transferase LipB [Bacteroidota bacterium]
MQQVVFKDLGRISYPKAWAYQARLRDGIIATKLDNRDLVKQGRQPLPIRHFLLFCEHPPVYTLGKSGSADHLLLNEEALREKGIEFFKINRGGDITYHGPGQIVGYPIFDLEGFFTDVHRYVRYLEEAVIRTLSEYGLEGYRIKDYTGVWLPEKGMLPKRKICAIGVHLSRWVTLHGFAFNVNTDLSHFRHIIPCGINDGDKDVTSLAFELGREVNMAEVRDKVKNHLANLFGFQFVQVEDPAPSAPPMN